MGSIDRRTLCLEGSPYSWFTLGFKIFLFFEAYQLLVLAFRGLKEQVNPPTSKQTRLRVRENIPASFILCLTQPKELFSDAVLSPGLRTLKYTIIETLSFHVLLIPVKMLCLLRAGLWVCHQRKPELGSEIIPLCSTPVPALISHSSAFFNGRLVP